MNDPAVSETVPERAPRLRAVVNSIAAVLSKSVSPGDLADLRRINSDEPASPAFWRIVTSFLGAYVPGAGTARDEEESRWASILSAMAVLEGLHLAEVPLGRALAAAGLSETRFVRLLRARGPALRKQLRELARFMAAKAAAADQADLADLVLSDGRARQGAVRRAISRAFYLHSEGGER